MDARRKVSEQMRKKGNRMVSEKSRLSNPFSTGSGGSHFEACVQASFVTLMLTGGYAPCLRCWPIVKIKLQGRIDGFETDDLIVFVENSDDRQQQKMLCQIKHNISITESSDQFAEFIDRAWRDFNNSHLFSKGNDAIALITGSLYKTDDEVRWLANHARTQDAASFIRDTKAKFFASGTIRKKLNVFRHHLKTVNKGIEVQDNELHQFLKHFYLLSYDLGELHGTALSLITSHIAQYNRQVPRELWGMILEFTQIYNHNAGVITINDLPPDLIQHFRLPQFREIENKQTAELSTDAEWANHPAAGYLALAVLLGGWDENNECDIEKLEELLGITNMEWTKMAITLMHTTGKPLSLNNRIWKVTNRTAIWKTLNSYIIEESLNNFQSIAISVLKEHDPALDLPPDERYMAIIHGKKLDHSHSLRKGIAEGIAILSSQQSSRNWSLGKAVATSNEIVGKLLADADWRVWASIGGLLPILAEAAPEEFLNSVENALRQKPCPFDELFQQEGGGTWGRSYIASILWALEALAWDENYLVRVCVILGGLAEIDPGGNYGNRPIASLIDILLPWLPQTLAPLKLRNAAIEAVLVKQPLVGWGLLLALIPGRRNSSMGTYKPLWRMTLPENWKQGVLASDNHEQVEFIANLALETAKYNPAMLINLLDPLCYLPLSTFNDLLDVLDSQTIQELSKEQRQSLWTHLLEFSDRHKQFSTADWALPKVYISRVDTIADKFAPSDPFYLYQPLFSGHGVRSFFSTSESRDEQRQALDLQRVKAIKSIIDVNGIDAIIPFADAASSHGFVGRALAAIESDPIEKLLLPDFLGTENSRHSSLTRAYVWFRHQARGWSWLDNIDKTAWTPLQIASFLINLPFEMATWHLVSLWLQGHQEEYWGRVLAGRCQTSDDYEYAINNFIEYRKPFSAISCLFEMLEDKLPLNTVLCVRALLFDVSIVDTPDSQDLFCILRIIESLQSNPTMSEEELFKIEWSYLAVLDRHRGAAPVLLERKLSTDPNFFCQVIQNVYVSCKNDQLDDEVSEKSRKIAEQCWKLLRGWKTVPGSDPDDSINSDHFSQWLKSVTTICTESGHLKPAFVHIGEVLIYSPPDPDGLWIHRSIATALDRDDADDMRDGFRVAKMNSRGVYTPDPNGRSETLLAEKFHRLAEELEIACFVKFANTMRQLENSYRQEAIRTQQEHQPE
jgi:hypothetical protein